MQQQFQLCGDFPERLCLGHSRVSDTVYTCVQVERMYTPKLNPIFETKNTTFLEKVWFFSFHQLNKINRRI